MVRAVENRSVLTPYYWHTAPSTHWSRVWNLVCALRSSNSSRRRELLEPVLGGDAATGHISSSCSENSLGVDETHFFQKSRI